MKLKDTSYNPLPDLFDLVGYSGIMLTNSTISSIAKVFNAGGIIAETEKELLTLIHLFIDYYGLLEFVKIDNIHYLRKVHGSEAA